MNGTAFGTRNVKMEEILRMEKVELNKGIHRNKNDDLDKRCERRRMLAVQKRRRRRIRETKTSIQTHFIACVCSALYHVYKRDHTHKKSTEKM